MRIPDQLYQAFFASAPIGCGISDARGKLIDFNQAMLDYSGWTREEIARMDGVADLYEDGPKERERLLGLARAGGKLERVEVRFKKKDGSSFLALMSLRPLDIDGQRYWLAVVEDVSARKRAETERERQMRELEQLTRVMAARENRMVELKERIRELEGKEDAP